MKSANRISSDKRLRLLVALVAAAAIVATLAPETNAKTRVTVTGSTGIQVWVDRAHEVFASYDDVVISVHANRGCYATVFVVDTFGFVHVIHPFSPYQSAWIRGGVMYRFSGRELGLDMLGGRGIAHVYAVSSPYPFDFSSYGEAIFAGSYGYRIYGDPYVACRQLYMSMLPVGFSGNWHHVDVGFARFYVREWTRYPVYLCRGPHGHGGSVHVRVGGRCHHCSSVYDTYRVHVNDPYVALRPAPRYKDGHAAKRAQSAEIKRTKDIDRYKKVIDRGRTDVVAKRTTRSSKIVSAKRTDHTVSVKRARAAKETKTAYTPKKTAAKAPAKTGARTNAKAKTNKSGVTRTRAKIQKGKVSR